LFFGFGRHFVSEVINIKDVRSEISSGKG